MMILRQHSKPLVLSGSQVRAVLANSYPFPPDWTSCCLLFATRQLRKSPGVFLLLRIRQVEFFWSILSLTYCDIHFR